MDALKKWGWRGSLAAVAILLGNWTSNKLTPTWGVAVAVVVFLVGLAITEWMRRPRVEDQGVQPEVEVERDIQLGGGLFRWRERKHIKTPQQIVGANDENETES